MPGFTGYELVAALQNEWQGGDGALQVTNLSSVVVSVTVTSAAGDELYELTGLGDSMSAELTGVLRFTITAASYPALISYLFGSDDSASLDTAPRVVVQSGVVTISGTITADVSGSTVGVSAVGGIVNVAGSVNVANTVDIGTVSGTVTIAGTVTASISSGTVDATIVGGSVSIAAGTVDIGSVTGDVAIVPGVFGLAGNGVAKVVSTNTAVAIAASSTPSKVLMLKARSANAGTVYIGTSTVTNNETAATGGLQLDPGDMIVFTATDLATVYVNGSAGDGVSFLYWT